MKTKLLLIFGLFLCVGTVEAGEKFSAGLKPKPHFTLFGQTISWPIPSLCAGAKAGVTPDAALSPEGLRLKIPYLLIEIPFPTLTIVTKTNRIDLKLGEVTKYEGK